MPARRLTDSYTSTNDLAQECTTGELNCYSKGGCGGTCGGSYYAATNERASPNQRVRAGKQQQQLTSYDVRRECYISIAGFALSLTLVEIACKIIIALLR